MGEYGSVKTRILVYFMQWLSISKTALLKVYIEEFSSDIIVRYLRIITGNKICRE